MVYNFTLPPLTLHAFLTGDASQLTRWAATLETPSDRNRPSSTLWPPTTASACVRWRASCRPKTIEQLAGARWKPTAVSSPIEHNSDGSRTPYELNIVYYDALNDPSRG